MAELVTAGAVQAGVEAPSEGSMGDSPVGLEGTEPVWLGPLPLGPPGITVDWTVSEVSVSQGVCLLYTSDAADEMD